jgi:hypothetical protein
MTDKYTKDDLPSLLNQVSHLASKPMSYLADELAKQPNKRISVRHSDIASLLREVVYLREDREARALSECGLRQRLREREADLELAGL